VLAGLLLGPVLALIAEAVPDYGGGGHTFRTCATCGAQESLTLTYRSTVTAVSCRSCEAPVPRGRRAISLATALAFGVTGLVVGPEWPLIPLLALAASLIALSAVDLARYRLPDKLMLPSLVVVATLVVVVSVLGDFTEHLIPALVGAVVYFVFLAIPSFLMPAAIGFGDVKLAALLGLGAGWMRSSALEAIAAVLYAAIIGMLLGAMTGLMVGIGRRVLGPGFLPDPDADPEELGEPASLGRTAAPFGPGLALGAFIFILISGSLMTGPNLL